MPLVHSQAPDDGDPEIYLSHLLSQLRDLLRRICNALERSNSPELVRDLIEQLRVHESARVSWGREWYNTAEAALEIGLSVYTTREACRTGRIQAKRAVNRRGGVGDWRISRQEIRRILDEGLPPPRPR